MANNKQWPKELTEKMIDLYLQGETYEDMAEALGKSLASVKQALSKIRKERNIPYREASQIVANRGKNKRTVSEFDKAYHGHIPCGHWMITKPWRKVS